MLFHSSMQVGVACDHGGPCTKHKLQLQAADFLHSSVSALCVYIKYKKYDTISSVAKNFLTAFDAVVN